MEVGTKLIQTGKLFVIIVITSFLYACSNSQQSSSPSGQFTSVNKASCNNAAIANRFIVKWKNGQVTTESEVDRETFISGFVTVNTNQIEYVEHDISIHLDESKIQTQSIPTVDPSWGQNITQAPNVWSQGYNGNGIIVAVVDSGMDYTHPQLKDQIAVNTKEVLNGIDDDKNGYIDDIHGYNFADDDDPTHPQASNDPMDTNEHGTHVSGIIAAKHSAGTIQGMAEQAKIMPLRFINASGGGSISAALKAIQYAADNGAKVINASWGGSDCSKTLQDTIASLSAKGIMFVAAAGNDGINLDRLPEYPAAYQSTNQITVVATTELDVQAEFSNYSFNLTQIGAPGTGILSTIPNGLTKEMDGTSMATPFVAGAVALLMSANPKASLDQVRNAIMNGSDHVQIADQSKGRLNIKKAIDLIISSK